MPTLPENAVLDYDFLRQEGIGHLERRAGLLWTDFNLHDPGITILEQFCYALTDLSYRIDYDLKDLLADGEADPYRSLPSPAEVLTTHPVTLTDFRKILIDTEGVGNAWLEPVEDPQPKIYYDPCDVSLYLEAAPHREPVALRGLYRALVAGDGSLSDPKQLAEAVDRRLHECRNLGQDFIPAKILDKQKIAIEATIETDPVEDADRLLAEIYHVLSRFIAPRIRFRTLAEMMAQGKHIDKIMDGPALRHGFIDTVELEALERKKALRVSDLIQEIMNVTGVAAIDSISIYTDKNQPKSWYMTLDQGSTPVLDVDRSLITLTRGWIPVRSDRDRMKGLFDDLCKADQFKPLPEAERDIRLPAGRDRHVGSYHSIQHQFPAVYGIGELGLPFSVSAQRQAQARQLKAYLLFFDQMLANCFAQLANVNKLFGSVNFPVMRTFGYYM
jgi:hypothetical protein